MVRVNGVDYPKRRSYSLNAYVGWADSWDSRLTPVDASGNSRYRIFNNQSHMATAMPDGIFLFMDVHPLSICGPAFGVKMDVDSFFNFPGVTHNRGAVVSFGDGHVEHHRWTDGRTVTAFANEYHSHSQASAGNRDLAWIRERTTVRR